MFDLGASWSVGPLQLKAIKDWDSPPGALRPSGQSVLFPVARLVVEGASHARIFPICPVDAVDLPVAWLLTPMTIIWEDTPSANWRELVDL